MTEPMAADDLCEHHYETRILGGHPIHVTACTFCRTPDWADLDEQAAELYRWGWQEGRDGKAARETLSAYDKPRQAQDGPQAPQDGPEAPDAGAETPDGTGGRQTGAEPLARLQRLRGQLAAEHAKAVHADQQPRPDLDHLRVTAPNGIAAGLENAIFFVDHHLREADEEARTTPDNPATGSDAADNPLREQIQAAIEDEIYEYRERTMFWEEGGVTTEIARLATRGAMEVRDREMEQLRAKVAEIDHIINWHTTCASCARILDSAYAETVRAETAEQQRDQLAGALTEALACLYSIERLGDPTPIGYQAIHPIRPASYDRWQAVLQPPTTEEPGEQP